MKILLFTFRFPYPPFRGDKLKIFNLAKNLSKNNSVTILTFHQNKTELSYLNEFQKYNINVVTVGFSFIVGMWNVFRALFSKVPLQVAFYQSGAMRERLQNLFKEENFDVVYFHLVRSLGYRDTLPQNSTLRIVDFTDSISLYISRIISVTKNPFKKLLLNFEFRRICKFEEYARDFHALFICSDIDKAQLLESHPGLNLKILPNGIDGEYFFPQDVEVEEKRIIFTGNIPYFANSDAIVYFAEEIFPLVLEKEPDAKFYIVGQYPTRKVKNLASSSIIVKGFVQDIRLEYMKSTVNIAPVRFGAGTLNKVLEPLALGVPVVCSSIAIAGMPSELKKYIFVADSKQEFADKILEIFNNPEIRNNLAREGSDKVRSSLNWNNVTAKFEQDIHELHNKLLNNN